MLQSSHLACFGLGLGTMKVDKGSLNVFYTWKPWEYIATYIFSTKIKNCPFRWVVAKGYFTFLYLLIQISLLKLQKKWTILFNKKLGADFPWVSNVNKLKRRTYAPALLLKNSCAVLRPVLRQAFFFWWRYYFLMKNYANNKWWRIHITSINR